MRMYFRVSFLLLSIVLAGAIFIVWQAAAPFISGVLPIVKPVPLLPDVDAELTLNVPEGFTVTMFARGVPGARVMIRDQKGTLLVSETSEGKVIALPDLNGDHRADRAIVVLDGLRQPHGLATRCSNMRSADVNERVCTLYVAETDAVRTYVYNADTYVAQYQKTLTTLPSGAGHFTRSLLMHPDGNRLLVSVGSSCNVCIESDSRRASILSADLATGNVSEFARGLRNTVFMTIHPVTGEVWGTEMGRDFLGDDIPPDEINILREGGDYGWPICYGKNVHDTDFDKNVYIRSPCMEPHEIPSHVDIQAHSAPLGLAFIPEEGWPEDYWHDLLVAYHGSWNRSVPTGYKVVRIDLDAKGIPTGKTHEFLVGFLNTSGTAIGRPVDVLAEPGGVVYISDDRAGAIYRVARNITLRNH